ncbi:hypothetical protein Poli38472_010712 [Pythium oligandrum]|uniref:PIPK domain-containing protein n=1 Tax=Pythium oligandrum TaxID=41045 RepID=A0A8K1FI30_PYTOL|nr:hypothetical protein Poli38472_010712 [Pythium oligandrum]|eukprot:TMW61649.1 hypothetical protein Poli38472_010712 [Pythium oligandrum]
MTDGDASLDGVIPPGVGNCPARNSFLPIMVSASSLLGCFYVIGTYAYVRALRQHPAGIMFGMSVYGAIYQLLYLIDRASVSVHCSQMAVFVDFFLTGQETYMLIFAIDLLMALKNPFSASKGQMKTYHVVGGLWSLSCALISQFDTHYALFGFCWVNYSGEIFGGMGEDGDVVTASTSKARLTSGIFFALYIVIVYCTSLVALLRTWNTFLKGLPDTFKTRHRIHRHLKYYVGCYFGYWTLVFACYAAFMVIPSGDDDTPGGVRCRVWHLLSCLLLGKGMVNALIWTRTSNILTIIQQLRQNGYVDLPPHDDSINWALRLEILTKTTAGICKSVEQAERQARASAVSATSSFDGERNSSENCAQIEEIVLENRNDTGSMGQRTDGVVFYDYEPQVFRHLRMEAKITAASYRMSMEQTTKEERVSEGKSGAFFYYTEDHKYVVKTMTREELKFLLSILPRYSTFIKNNPNTFVTRFFGCHSITMYGKTVFFMVMQSVFDTPLQIHERFDLKGSWVGRLEGRKPTGTIAKCKFCSKEYVVGGSHDQLCDVRRGEGNLRHQYDQVGKDLNWNRHMALPRSTARAVAHQLTKDSNFLCSINCIDYSLLVGIHHRSFNVSHYSTADSLDVPRSSCCSMIGRHSGIGSHCGSSSMPKSLQQAMRGGMTVDEVHGPGIYFMGLIDILQQWNLRKRAEHFIRVYILMQDRCGISVVNPRQYADRFQERVLKEFIYDGMCDVDEPPLPQALPDHLDPMMYESGRTLSTVLNSFDLGSDPSVLQSERFGREPVPVLPTVPSIPVMPLPSSGSSGPSSSRRRAATLGSSPPSTYHTPSPPLRYSGGFVMEGPGACAHPHSRTSLPVLSPSFVFTPPTCVDLPHQIRRPLMPITQSPRPSSLSASRSESELSFSSNDRASTLVHASSVSALAATTTNNNNNNTVITIETSPTLLDNALSYRIIQTPTFPDRNLSTMSA